MKDAPAQNGRIGELPVVGKPFAVEDGHFHVAQDDGVLVLLQIDGVDAVAQ